MIIRQISFTKFIQYSSTRLSLSTYIYISKRFMFRLKHLGTKLLTPIRPTIIRTHFGPFNLVYPDIIIPNILQGDGISIFAPPKPLLLTSDISQNKPLLLTSDNMYYESLSYFNFVQHQIFTLQLVHKYFREHHFTEMLSGLKNRKELINLLYKPEFIKAYLNMYAETMSTLLLHNNPKNLVEVLLNIRESLKITLNTLKTFETLNLVSQIIPLKQHILCYYFKNNEIPKDLLIHLVDNDLIDLTNIPDKIKMSTVFEFITLYDFFKDYNKKNRGNNRIKIILLDPSNIHLLSEYNKQEALKQTKQINPDCLIMCYNEEGKITHMVYKDVKTGGSHAIYFGRITYTPKLFSDLKIARNYTLRYITDLNKALLEKPLTIEEKSIIKEVMKELQKLCTALKPDLKNIEPIMHEINVLLLENMFKPALKQFNFSISMDPGQNKWYAISYEKDVAALIEINYDKIKIKDTFSIDSRINIPAHKEYHQRFFELMIPQEAKESLTKIGTDILLLDNKPHEL